MAKNILVCDDAAFMRMMIKNTLTKGGYNIAGEAENGAKAVEKYKELYDKRKSRLDEQIDALDALERERELRASLEAATDSEPVEIPEAAPDEEPTVYEPAVVPLEPEIDFDLSLRPTHAELPAAA